MFKSSIELLPTLEMPQNPIFVMAEVQSHLAFFGLDVPSHQFICILLERSSPLPLAFVISPHLITTTGAV
jgi:hypothetical protein